MSRASFAVVATLAIATVGTTQIAQVIKIIGIGAAVRQFGPKINDQFNRLTKHKDSSNSYTKVVPILTIGLNSRGAIGAAQVMGSKSRVERVQAVAAPEAEIFGNEIKIRALIPVDKSDITNMSDVRPVDGVGVSGIVDLKL